MNNDMNPFTAKYPNMELIITEILTKIEKVVYNFTKNKTPRFAW